jgi:predicted nucleic acid-binding protein
LVESAAASRFLTRHVKLGLDTSILIYLVQDHPRYGAWCAGLFARIERNELDVVASTVSYLEALVLPYRVGNEELLERFYGLLDTYPHLTWVPMTITIADRAAELRARYHLSTPDAIQIATAIEAGATGFIGNDNGFRKVREIECLVLDDVV